MYRWQLQQRQALPLEAKIEMSKLRIKEWYEHFNGNVYIAFSGGLDSTVVLDLVRSMYPETKAMFCDTGLEFPEIREFVKTFDNVDWIKPTMQFPEVIAKYGYPVISKEQAQFIEDYRHTKSEKMKKLRWYGKDDKRNNGRIADRYRYLINAPFEISDRCCYYLKKTPAKKYEKLTAKKPILGLLADESRLRETDYLRHGCNSFDTGASRPIAFWKRDDVWEYLKQKDLPYCNVYDKGYTRTGCIFCMFGVHLEKEPNRFQILKKTHPVQYKYCMEKLGIKKVLDYMGVPSE